MLNHYKTVDGKKLRMGYTTGSCAAAAAKAAAIMVLTQKKLTAISIITPKGITLNLEAIDCTIEKSFSICGIRKDAGDDPDVTHKAVIYVLVELISGKEIRIKGGDGVGRVTKPGLNQPVGEAAINSVPRKMITQELLNVKDELLYDGGFSVEISVENGERLAAKTFNPRLGIVGGISILGTSGIVEPMSDEAIINTIYTEIDVIAASGRKYLLLTPGNYGKTYLNQEFSFEDTASAKVSNFIGLALEYAAEKSFKGVLIVGHAGKMVKLCGGMFNTHSRYGDCRGEIISAAAIHCGADNTTLKNILDAATVDEMLSILKEHGIIEQVANILKDKMYKNINDRIYGAVQVEAVVYTQKFGLIFNTEYADDIARKIKEELK